MSPKNCSLTPVTWGHCGISDRAGGQGAGRRAIERYAAGQVKVLLGRPDRKDETKRRFGNLARTRQWIEAIFGTLKDQLALERHGGRTPAKGSRIAYDH